MVGLVITIAINFRILPDKDQVLRLCTNCYFQFGLYSVSPRLLLSVKSSVLLRIRTGLAMSSTIDEKTGTRMGTPTDGGGTTTADCTGDDLPIGAAEDVEISIAINMIKIKQSGVRIFIFEKSECQTSS